MRLFPNQFETWKEGGRERAEVNMEGQEVGGEEGGKRGEEGRELWIDRSAKPGPFSPGRPSFPK